MSNLLTAGELLDLTGTPQRNRQLTILRGHELRPIIRADGSIAISWEAINATMLGRIAKSSSPEEGEGVDLAAANG